MANHIASGTTAASSAADFTLADGAAATLNLFGAAGVPSDARATVEILASNSTYVVLGEMNAGNPAMQVFGPGTYRVSKSASAVAYGVDKS
jgi:hypothetical protein